MLLPSKMTLLRRTLLWLSAIAAVTFFTLIVMGVQVRDTIRQNGLLRMHNILLHKIEDIHIYVQQQYGAMDNLKQLVYFASCHHPIFSRTFWHTSSDTLQNSLIEFAGKNRFYDLFIITREGDIVYTAKHESDLNTNLLRGEFRNTELARVFREALKQNPPRISDFYFYAPSRDFAAFMAEPIVEKGEVIGVVAVQLDNKTVQSVINNYEELGETGDVLAAVSRRGKMMSVSTTRFGDTAAYAYFNPDKMVQIDQAAMGKKGQTYTTDYRGHKVAAAWGYQDELNMGLAVKIDQFELLKEWYKQITTLFFLFAAGIGVVIWMIVVAMKSFAKPIQELTRYALSISEGNYKIESDYGEYDQEWQVLTHAFHTMAMEIDHRMTQLNDQNVLLVHQKNEIEELNLRLEARIKAKTKQLNAFIGIIDEYVITSQTDREGNITYASEAFCRMSGYAKEELIGENHRIVRHLDMPKKLFEGMWQTISSGNIWHGEIKNRMRNGGYYWMDLMISPNVEEGKITGYTAVGQDITNQKIIEELAITDSMTGLYNRRHYVTTIKEEMNRVKRHGSSLALMMLDVDHFKLYNDTYGHQAGDTVLGKVADVLKYYTSRSGEYAFRLGGEEFGVLLSSMSREEYLELAERIRDAVEGLKLAHEMNSASVYVTVSIGIALFEPYEERSCEELYKEADTQLYIAKEAGRNQVAIRGE